ncbi:hypothetical protein SAMD00024442_45_17 [Candidatus Symbiothrix dinenymphae]|nr:hypothetical protein SAMD00024442_45_17 [Candidatus Symbiothrix dinenymphae]
MEIEMRRTICIILLILTPTLCFGFASITNVQFEQTGDVVIITYDLNGSDKLEYVEAFMTINGTTQQLTKVTGDVGEVVGAGRKQIMFAIFDELGNKPIEGNISFMVQGKDARFFKELNKQGVRHEQNANYTEAAKCYRTSAEGGYDAAQYNLGLLYEFGYGVKKSKKEAKEWYRKAAEQGLLDAKAKSKKL